MFPWHQSFAVHIGIECTFRVKIFSIHRPPTIENETKDKKTIHVQPLDKKGTFVCTLCGTTGFLCAYNVRTHIEVK